MHAVIGVVAKGAPSLYFRTLALAPIKDTLIKQSVSSTCQVTTSGQTVHEKHIINLPKGLDNLFNPQPVEGGPQNLAR